MLKLFVNDDIARYKPKATILLRWLMIKGDSGEYEEWLRPLWKG